MKKIDNFNASLKNLKIACEREFTDDPVIIAGTLGLFQLTFELAWKAMKSVLEDTGYKESATGSPKMILKTAFYAGLIDDEELWLDALTARNNSSHIYNADIAYEIISRIKSDYYGLFEKLSEEFEKTMQ